MTDLSTEQDAAEAAFAATDAPEKAAPVANESTEAKTTATEVVPVKESDPWEGVPPIVRQTLEGITGKMGAFENTSRSLKETAGRIQSENAKFEKMMATAQAAAKTVEDSPSKSQISAAATSVDKWKQMKEDFPEWTDAMDERLAAERAGMSIPKADVKADMDAFANTFGESVSKAISASEGRAREVARLDSKYEDWEDRVNDPEFKTWVTTQPPEIAALVDSTKAKDAIRMIDLYKQHADTEAAKAKKQQRLESAIPVRGSGAPVHQTTTEQDAAEKAFASA